MKESDTAIFEELGNFLKHMVFQTLYLIEIESKQGKEERNTEI